jgi:hypothetical protein
MSVRERELVSLFLSSANYSIITNLAHNESDHLNQTFKRIENFCQVQENDHTSTKSLTLFLFLTVVVVVVAIFQPSRLLWQGRYETISCAQEQIMGARD